MYNLKLMKIKINEEINFSIFNFKTLKSQMISQEIIKLNEHVIKQFLFPILKQHNSLNI